MQLTFISSRFGGRDTGLVPRGAAELWQMCPPWLEGTFEEAAAGRGGEEEVVELKEEEEEEDGC